MTINLQSQTSTVTPTAGSTPADHRRTSWAPIPAQHIRPDWRTNPTTRIRRPSRAQETSALHRGRALLHMQARLADSQAQWLRDVDAHITDLPLRADAKQHRRTIARMIGFNADWHQLITRTLTWDTIAAHVGLTRRSVARHLRALHEAGFLGRVAAGRSAAAKQAAGWTGPEADHNDAPVYALTTPTPTDPVDTNVTPPTLSGHKEFPARARETKPPHRAAARHSINEAPAASGGSTTQHPAHRDLPAWPSHVPAKRKEERVQAGLALQARIPALRKLSAKHIAALTRVFMLSGWTVSDLHHALDTRPDGQPHGHFVNGAWTPYTGADGIPAARLGHWVRFRLAHWLDNHDTPREAPSQHAARRRQAEAQRRAAQTRRRQEREAQRRANYADAEYQQAKAEALAFIRSLNARTTQ